MKAPSKITRHAAKLGILAARSLGLIDPVCADFWLAVLGLSDA
ncbi:MAG: hypothetical protein AB7S81_08175 [Bdellovibrionales bacterium]